MLPLLRDPLLVFWIVAAIFRYAPGKAASFWLLPVPLLSLEN
jgi:hypothetical protein